MYAEIKDGAVQTYPYSLAQLKSENSNTSFPKAMSTDILESYNVHTVIFADAPSINNRTQKAIQRDIERDMQGQINTSSPQTTNMQPTSRDTAMGGGKTTASSTAKSSSATNPYSGGPGGIHSGE